jgi:hypothetical protein
MNKKTKIILFIVVFCAILIIPFAVNAGKTASAVEVSLDTPEINALSEKKCVEDTQWMRENHMKLLDDWRNEVVRDGSTQYVASDGTVYEKSLDDTCLSCHSNPEEFCNKCHENANVDLYCWDCHGTTDPDLHSTDSNE